MQIEKITVKFGMTQNLGNYTNCRPEIELQAIIDEHDDPAWEIAALREMAVEMVHKLVDDELEQAGEPPKYTKEPLYSVFYAIKRGIVVVSPAGAKLPEISNWLENDAWSRQYDMPPQMRLSTAMEKAALLAREHDYTLLDCSAGNFGDIPSLPDPGPEPTWHAKSLKRPFEHLQIPETEWEELAVLEHVTDGYLSMLYHHNLEREPLETRLTIIRENAPWPPVFLASEDVNANNWEEEDYDDDDF
ncbi:MAG: hypothetical protein H6662_15705 [Ardenticatenaceae bacterium]|nr:hypothetical protein [Anaerolineales bacterium]MCB8923033.1 hypothetical protein [Ardenticatenaceae bacterium]